MPDDLCPARIRLSDVVARAIQAIYRAKSEYAQAVKNRQDLAPLKLPLAEARLAKRDAVKALDAHRKEHGC